MLAGPAFAGCANVSILDVFGQRRVPLKVSPPPVMEQGAWLGSPGVYHSEPTEPCPCPITAVLEIAPPSGHPTNQPTTLVPPPRQGRGAAWNGTSFGMQVQPHGAELLRIACAQ